MEGERQFPKESEVPMLDALSTPQNRILTIVFLAACGIAALGAGLVGISDNPPGILLAFLSVAAFILAFVHPWRTVKKYKYLFYASGLGFILFAVLHNVFEALAATSESVVLLQGLLQVLSVTAFMIAVLLCPVAILIGVVGTITMFIRNRLHPTQA